MAYLATMIVRMNTLMLFAFMAGFGPWAHGEESAPVVPPASVESLWFPVGEVLHYDISWGYFNVGRGVVSTEWVDHDDGRTLIKIRFETLSNRVIAIIYPVDDLQYVLIDPATFLPVEFYRKSRQGKFRAHERVTFQHDRGVAYRELLDEERTEEIAIEPETRDLVTYMYLVRGMRVGVGDSLRERVFSDDGVYEMTIEVTEREDIDLDTYGVVPSLRFEPEAEFEGLFVRKDKMLFWVSDDERRLCTQIATKVAVGSIRIKLVEVLGPGEDAWVKTE